jgi:predicted PurR-regulated permease PerM
MAAVENRSIPEDLKDLPLLTMDLKLTPGRLYGAAIAVLSVWLLQGFLHGMLAASAAAIASWPVYSRFAARVRGRLGRHTTSLVFTAIITVFVLAPMLFAFWALLSEVHGLFHDIVGSDGKGSAVRRWLEDLPVVGGWAASRWHGELASPGAAQGMNAPAVIGLAQSLGQFAAHHLLVVVFTILLLHFLYEEGESLARDFRGLLREGIGEHAERHVHVVTRAVRASVNSMLVVGLFNGLATGLLFALVGVPRAAVWAAIVGSMAAVPFLGYAAVGALALRMAFSGDTTPALVSLLLGCLVLLCGDKVVRPLLARDGLRLPFVWILMACLGGFEVLGLVGLVVGPVVLALAREIWNQRVRQLGRAHAVAAPSTTPSNQASHASNPL